MDSGEQSELPIAQCINWLLSALDYQVGLSVGIPVIFLLTAIICSLLTLLVTYQCLTRRGGRSHDKFTPQQELVNDHVSTVSGTRPAAAAVEMKNNVAYGTTSTGLGTTLLSCTYVRACTTMKKVILEKSVKMHNYDVTLMTITQ